MTIPKDQKEKLSTGKTDKVLKKTFIVPNRLGLHARPAALLVQLTNTFNAEITVENNGSKVNGKSIMGLMMLAAAYNTRLHFEAHGPDSQVALTKIKELFDKKFHEK